MSLIERYIEEINQIKSVEALERYIACMNLVLANKGTMNRQLAKTSVQGLKKRVSRTRTNQPQNKRAKRLLVYKLLAVLSRSELEYIRNVAQNRLERFRIEELVKLIKE